MSNTSNGEEGATGGHAVKTETTGGFETKSKEIDEKGAIGGHAVKTETTSNQAEGDTGISQLIIAMNEAFKRSSDKSSSSDSISRNVALKQTKPYSLGQHFKVLLSQFDEYSKLANIPESRKREHFWSLC